MSKTPLQAVIASKESRSLLLFLDECPTGLDGLTISMGATKEQLHSIIGLLEECYLITGENGIYRLTRIGELITGELKPLLNLEEFINTAENYWLDRELDFIPPSLLKKLHEVNSCTVIQPRFSDIYDYNKEAHEASTCSKSFSMAAAGLHPSFPDLFGDMINRGVNLSLIFDPSLFEKVKRDNYDELQKLVNNRQVALYLYSHKMHFVSFKVNDTCIVLKLLTKNNTYDHKQLICHSPDAVEWGKELFNYYLQDSMLLTEI
jgi:predicted transcriptional regulator